MNLPLIANLGKTAAALAVRRSHSHSRTVKLRAPGADSTMHQHMDGRNNAQPPYRYGRSVPK